MSLLKIALHAHVTQAASVFGVEIPVFSVTDAPAHQHGFDVAVDLPLKMARLLGRSPFIIATTIADALREIPLVSRVEAVMPGFVNIAFSDIALASALAENERWIQPFEGTTIIDFGGPNIKPMHVGHLRSLVLGESLRRILSLSGEVVSDIHWGDWGLPCGMVLAWLEDNPSSDATVDIGAVYPAAAALAKEDAAFMVRAREATRLLQAGDPILMAQWDCISSEAKDVILKTVVRLGAHFDLLLGEQDAEADVPAVVACVMEQGGWREDSGVLLLPVEEPHDTKDVPPVVLRRADGSSLYAATDLATLLGRERSYAPTRVVYVVDSRQSLHFLQVFRAARKWGIVSAKTELVHRDFGTVNGPGGKPLRTRAGDAMPLQELIDTVVSHAAIRLKERGRIPENELDEAAECIGIAALKVADLSQSAKGGYILDVEQSLHFEGNTGPALLYAVVRLRSAISKAHEKGLKTAQTITSSLFNAPGGAKARALLVELLAYPDAVQAASTELEPCRITEWAFRTAAAVGRFWEECPILSEPDMNLVAQRLMLAREVEGRLSQALYLLGCKVPSAM